MRSRAIPANNAAMKDNTSNIKLANLRKLKELRKMTKGIQEGMDKSTPIKEVDTDATFNVVATKVLEKKGR